MRMPPHPASGRCGTSSSRPCFSVPSVKLGDWRRPRPWSTTSLRSISVSGFRSGSTGSGLGTVCVVVLLVGKYAVLELVTKIMAALLFISTVAVYVAEPAPISAMGHFFSVEVPDGSWLIIAAFLGLLPTGIDVSLQASEWGKAKKVGMGRIRGDLERAGLAPAFDPLTSPSSALRVDTSKLPDHALEYCRRWFRIGEWDFRVGHVVSMVDRGDLPVAVGGVALPERGGWNVRHRRDSRHFHPQCWAEHDAGVSRRRLRRYVLDGVQLLRRLASRGGRVLSESVSPNRPSLGDRQRGSRRRASRSLVFGI